MLKSLKRVGGVALAAALVVGCDDARSTDKAVMREVQKSRTLKTDDAQAALKKAAQEASSGGSDATKAHVNSMLANAEMNLAIQQMNAPKVTGEGATIGVEAGHREIVELLWEISQLADQIRSSNAMLQAYKLYEPTQLKALAAQKSADAAGGPGKVVWIGDQQRGVPTLSQVNQDIAQIQGQISGIQDQIKTLQGQQLAAAQQAERSMRQSEASQGRTSIDQYAQSSKLRKDAADIANKVDVLSSKLPALQTDLGIAQGRAKYISAAVTQFNQLGQKFDDDWKNIDQESAKQQALAKTVYQGTGAGDPKAAKHSIAARAEQLGTVNKQTEEAYTNAQSNLVSAIGHFQQAAQAADKLKTELGTKIAEPGVRSTSVGRAIEAMTAAYNPAIFRSGEANARQLLASLDTSRLMALLEQQKLMAKIQPILQQAQLAVPKGLDDAGLAAKVKELAEAADKDYADAQEAYDTVATAPQATDAARGAGRIGKIMSLYSRAQLAKLLGKPGDQYLGDAKKAVDEIVTDKGYAALPSLPAVLIPPPPSTAPAATSPAATTAPAAPAPAEPGATPAPAPAEPAATPATPATAPAATPAP